MSLPRPTVLAGLVSAVAAGTLLLGGCQGFDTAAAPGGSATGGSTATEAADVKLGWTQVDEPFAAPAAPGEAITAGDTAGASPTTGADGGPVLVNLWASWCGPCQKELPLLERYSRTGDVSVVGVSEDSSAGDATHALEAAGITYPSWLDDGDTAYLDELTRVVPQALPSSVLVVDGMVVAVHIGSFDDEAGFAPIARFVKAAQTS